MTSSDIGSPGYGRGRLRLWMILFILSWLPIFTALLARTRILVDKEWWEGIYTVFTPAPSAAWLRIYWFATTPLLSLGLVTAALLLLARRPSAGLFATACFAVAVTIGIGECLLLTIIHFQFTAAISAVTGIPRAQVAGFQLAILATLAELFYRASCLIYLLFSRNVREAFGPVTWVALSVVDRAFISGRRGRLTCD